MAGSLDGRTRRVRRLEEKGRRLERRPPSQTEEEARELDAEIREIDEEMHLLGKGPDEWRHNTGGRGVGTGGAHSATREGVGKVSLRVLAGRVGRLENGRGRGGNGCGYCGGGGPGDETWEVFFEGEEPEDLEETCPQCGCELVSTIYFPEDEPGAPAPRWRRY